MLGFLKLILFLERDNDDENKYIAEHMKLIKEKDALIRKQDYLNVAAKMNEIQSQMEEVQQKINEATEISGQFLGSVTNLNHGFSESNTTEDESRAVSDLVETYKSLINKKNELAELLLQKEDE